MKFYIIIIFILCSCEQVNLKKEPAKNNDHQSWKIDSFVLDENRVVQIRFPLDSGYHTIGPSHYGWDSKYNLDLSNGVDSLHFSGYNITSLNLPDSTRIRDRIKLKREMIKGYKATNVKIFTKDNNNYLIYEEIYNTHIRLIYAVDNGKSVAFSIYLETRNVTPEKRLAFEKLCNAFTFEVLEK